MGWVELIVDAARWLYLAGGRTVHTVVDMAWHG